ncbi:ATP-binding protein [uncultured Thiodictyon sp.]|uniref:ATP-binding protein n=1 Tax=uncultured Thiodictyon sp. TaxID=1846217 RepID=UPI0025F0BB10|nr:ATP-binding protein [uncultured Thiodictyon sp.]
MTDDGMDYRLLRLILIDSYSPGRVVEFPLEGGAVLTGRNGRGKTTLLQLLPIFYGENPTRIVGTETNRLDFNGYYLPRLTSYIVFEYQRRDLTCLVVLHANEQGGERRYRFVRSPYRPDLFLLPDGQNILQAPDLRRHFKLKGIIHSEAIGSVAEYRGIIQGKVGSTKTRSNQRALVADYACCGAGHHLTHIEKIVSGMFLRRTDFQDLQRMVVSCISDTDAEIALTTERRKIAAWPQHYGAYSRAMEESGRMGQVLEREARLTAVESELGRIHARILRLLARLDETDTENRRARAHQAAQANDEEQAHRQSAEGIRLRLESAGREAKEQAARVAALEGQQADWLRRDLPAKAELVLREPDLRARHAQLQRRREALLGEQEAISLKYERLLNDLDRRHTLAEGAAGEARTALFQGFEPRLRAVDEAARTDLERLRETHRGESAAIDTRLHRSAEAKGEWRQQVRAPQAKPELVAIRDTKQADVTTLEQEREAADQALRRARETLAKATAAHQDQEQALATLRRQRDDLERRRQARLLQQSPGADTLLHFLRTRQPDWVFDIAKVVREDLLIRTDLDPGLIDSLPTLYGVGLDLSHVDAHLAADEEGLRREIAELEAQRSRLDAQRVQAEQALGACEQARRQADTGATLANAGLAQLGTRLESARAERAAAQRRMDQDLKEAAQRARQQLAELERAEAALQAEKKAQDERHQAAITAREQRQADERHAIETERHGAIEAHDRAQTQRRQGQAVERAGIVAERDQRLCAAGVDTAALQALERDLKDTETALSRIEHSRGEVSQWQLWQQNDWPRKDEHARAAQDARSLETAARADLTAEDKRWQTRGAELSAGLQRLDRDHEQLELERSAVRGRVEQFRAYPPDAQIAGQPFDPGWTLDALTTQANGNQTEATTQERGIRTLVEQIKRAFSAQRDAPPDQFYETHREALGPDAPARAWVPVFKTWFDSDHDAYRRILATDAQQIAGAIVAFHRDMDAFHRKVQQFNRELAQSLDDNLGFESVSRVTVKVISVIRELEYWQPIEAMAEEHRAWLRLDGQDLPPPEFADTLRTLLDHWEVREGIRAALPSLIRIEGEVVENGQTRTFRKAADLERVSSNGLSYLILCVIFIAFINRIRRQARVEIVWALDELKDLDIGNIEALLAILKRNAITLASAFPDPDAEVLALFRHRFSVEEGRRLLEARVVGQDEEAEPDPGPDRLSPDSGNID